MWETRKAFEEVTATFLALSCGPTGITEDQVIMLECFTILLYNRTSSKVHIDDGYSLSKDGQWMQFPQPELLSCNISEGLCTKVDTAGARCCRLQLGCHQLETGDGSTPATGGQGGSLYLRLVLLLEK